MMDYISEKINKYDNEGKILMFLKENNLPEGLDAGVNASNYLLIK